MLSRRLFADEDDAYARDDEDDRVHEEEDARDDANEPLINLELHHALNVEALEETIAQMCVERELGGAARAYPALSPHDLWVQDEYEVALAESAASHAARFATPIDVDSALDRLGDPAPARHTLGRDGGGGRAGRGEGPAVLDEIDLLAQDSYELAFAHAQGADSCVFVFADPDGASRLDVDQMRDTCELAAYEARCRADEARARLVDVQDALELARHELNVPAERARLHSARRMVESRASALQRRVALLIKTCAQQRDELASIAGHERAAHNTRLHFALSEQRAELERSFQARIEWASKQRASREAADRQKRARAASVGMARGDAVARDLARMAPPDALL